MESRSPEHLSESLEDYLEAILQIINKNGVAWPRDIAKTMKVSNASVTGALRALSERNLVNYAPYVFVTLTPEGEVRAKEIASRHASIQGFLRDFLGVEPQLADETACKMEHILAPEIIQKFVRLAAFMKSSPCGGKEWLEPGIGTCEHCRNCAAKDSCGKVEKSEK